MPKTPGVSPDVLPEPTGVRWDTEFVPQSINGPAFSSATGFDLNELVKIGFGTSRYSPV